MTVSLRPALALTAATAAVVAAGMSPALAPAGPTGKPAAESSSPTASAAAKCNARILRGARFVNLKQFTYRYRFRRVPGTSRYKRVIVRLRVNVRVNCARRCVLTRRRRGKRRPVYSLKRVRVKARRGNRIVTIRRLRRVYRFGRCPASANSGEGTPISIDLLPGSVATLDFGAFRREAALSGSIRGLDPDGVRLSQDNLVELTRGNLTLAQTPVFIDDDCDGQASASIRTGVPATIKLDPAKNSTSTLTAEGGLTSVTHTLIRLPLELRNDDDGCGRPYITTGYTEFKKTFFLRGRLDGGLQRVVLTSPPDVLDVEACLWPGAPTQPCSGFIIPLPIMVSTRLVVSIQLNAT